MNPNATPAQLLKIDLETRITTAKLHYRSGSEETAATSASSVFETVRKLLASHHDAPAFERVAMAMINSVMRPYTARWHGWMTEDARELKAEAKPATKFRNERVRRMFRAELEELQARLKNYTGMLGTLSKVPATETRVEAAELLSPAELKQLEEDEAAVPRAKLGSSLVAGIGGQVPIAGTITGGTLFKKEREKLASRRASLGNKHAKDTATELHNATGLALSGGGIRSATFCLGIVQVLQQKGLLLKFDYLSTVSGGGYLGAFISTSLGTQIPGYAPAPQKRAEDTFQRIGEKTESILLRHIRNNSKYLLNGGLYAKLQIVGLMVGGFLWNLLMVLPVPLFLALLVYHSQEFLWGAPILEPGAGGSPFPPLSAGWHGFALKALVIATLVLWILLPPFQRCTHGLAPGEKWRKARACVEKLCTWLQFGTFIVAVLYLIPAMIHGYAWLVEQVQHWHWNPDWLKKSGKGDASTLATGGVVSLALGFLAKWITPRLPFIGTLFLKLFILSGPVLALLIFLATCHQLGMGTAKQGVKVSLFGLQALPLWQVILAASVLVMLWTWLFVNVNTLAPHRYYRDKLCECYLTRRTASAVETLQQVKLSDLGKESAAPYHLINMTLNVPASQNKDLRGRGSDFFFVSKDHIGSPLTGYTTTAKMEKVDPHFDLGTAMAVSAAAASTSMGWKSLPQYRFLMALFNIRLGYWLRRPGTTALPKLIEGAGPWYYFRELRGSMTERGRYVNLSDGGHIENLAVYELLRRRAKFIVCVDGGAEPGMECTDLIRLERYATIDLDIALHYDLADLRLQSNGLTRAHAILVKIEYDASLKRPAHDPGKQLGWMLYLKLALTGAEPGFVREYRREHPTFPHETTANQFFNEDQFEAYRALGVCAMNGFFRTEITGAPENTQPTTLGDWFQNLANKLLPDNDEAFR